MPAHPYRPKRLNMKKWMFVLIGLPVVLLVCCYVFIPSELVIASQVYVKASTQGTERTIHRADCWQQWATGSGLQCALDSRLYNGATIHITGNDFTFTSQVMLISKPPDSTLVNWEIKMPASYNPVTRIRQYHRAVALKSSVAIVLQQMTAYLSNNRNIYGYAMQLTDVQDKFMAFTTKTYAREPDVSTIYNTIARLREFVKAQGAAETNFPMLNLVHSDSGYIAMTAIPASQPFENKGDIVFKGLVPGKYLMTTLNGGGNATIQQAIDQMNLYIRDYRKTPVAVPFQSLVTDRSLQPDTGKWVTRIYYPIF